LLFFVPEFFLIYVDKIRTVRFNHFKEIFMPGTTREIVGLYHDFVAVSVLGTVHVVNMLITTPLKTASQHFIFNKLIA